MPWSHDDCHHGAVALPLIAGATNCPNPFSQPKKKHHQCRKPDIQVHLCGEGDMGGTMMQQKGESWGLTGSTNFCPLKPMWWLQRADAFSYT
eukprot:5842734-Ditylum_brightwellii.AAC.1